MKKTASAIAAVMILSSSFAWAWSDVSGTIKDINADTRQITLDDGKVYSVESGVNLANLKVGDKIVVTTESRDGKNMVNKVTKS